LLFFTHLCAENVYKILTLCIKYDIIKITETDIFEGFVCFCNIIGKDYHFNMNKINKRQFIDKLAYECNLSRADAARIYEIFIKLILTELLVNKKAVSFTGFGTFSLKSHKGHNVQFSKDRFKCDDYVNIKFKPSDILGKKIRMSVNNKNSDFIKMLKSDISEAETDFDFL